MLSIKESVKILFIVTVSVLTVGCKKHNAEYNLSENTEDVSSVISETRALCNCCTRFFSRKL